MRTDPDKIKVVQEWSTPQNVQELQSFLGFAGFYRRFVKDFAKVAHPLHTLTRGNCGSKQHRKKQGSGSSWFWDAEHQDAFDKIKELLISAPVLTFANYTKPFELHTNASHLGLGAVLYQEVDGKQCVVSYASRELSPSERNYPAHKLEFLALKWSITEKFHDYLYGSSFVACTDNNPLTYIITSAKLDATGQRWAAQLANYDFQIKYRSGKANVDADLLSRLKIPPDTSVKVMSQVV